jgi:hypothetical protein
MKTIEQRDATLENATMLLLLAFFTLVWLSMDHEALSQLLHAFKSNWLDFTNWAASGMMNPHRIKC